MKPWIKLPAPVYRQTEWSNKKKATVGRNAHAMEQARRHPDTLTDEVLLRAVAYIRTRGKDGQSPDLANDITRKLEASVVPPGTSIVLESVTRKPFVMHLRLGQRDSLRIAMDPASNWGYATIGNGAVRFKATRPLGIPVDVGALREATLGLEASVLDGTRWPSAMSPRPESEVDYVEWLSQGQPCPMQPGTEECTTNETAICDAVRILLSRPSAA